MQRVAVLEPGDASSVGELVHFAWRSLLPYSLEFDLRVTRVQRPPPRSRARASLHADTTGASRAGDRRVARGGREVIGGEGAVGGGQRPYLIEAHATGELEGVGVWRLYEGQGTAIVYDWRVRTTKWWMNVFGPLARPVFAWNHDLVMRQGGHGLAAELGATLLAHD